MADKKTLYEALNGNQYYEKSYEEFDKQFSTDEQISKLYGALNSGEFYTKSLDEFKAQFFADQKKPVYAGGIDISDLEEEDQALFSQAMVNYKKDLEEFESYSPDNPRFMTPMESIGAFKTKMEELSKQAEEGDIDKEDVLSHIAELENLYGVQIDENGSIVPTEASSGNFKKDFGRYYKQALQDKEKKEAPNYAERLIGALASGTEAAIARGADFFGGLAGLNYLVPEFKTAVAEKKRIASEMSQKYDIDDRTIEETLKDGDAVDVLKKGVIKSVESLPEMLPLLLTKDPSALYYMGATSAQDKYRQLENVEIPEWEKLYNSMITGLAEVAFEGSFTVPLINKTKAALTRYGLESVERTTKNAISRTLNNAASRVTNVPAAAQEAFSEIGTQFTQNLVDKVTVDPNKDLSDGLVDAGVIGGITGKLIQAPADIAITADRARTLAQAAFAKMPTNINTETKVNVGSLIAQKEMLNEKKKQYDPAFHGPIDEEISTIDNQVKSQLDAKETRKKAEEAVQEEAVKPEEMQRTGIRDTEKAGVEAETKTETTKEVEPVIPAETLSEANKSFEAAKENLSEVDAATESFKTIERSDFFKNLEEKQQETVKQKYFNEITDRFTERPTEKKTREPLPSKEGSKKIVVNDWTEFKRSLKEREKASRQGLKEGQRRSSEAVSEVVDRVREFVKSNKGNLTPTQYNSIIGRLTKAVKSDRQLSNLIDYVDKSIQSAEYANEIGKSESIRSKLAKKAKTSDFKKNFAQQMPRIRKFISIKPSTLSPDDIKMYNQIASNIQSGKIDPAHYEFIDKYKPEKATTEFDTKIAKAKTRRDVQKSMLNLESDIENISSVEDFSRVRRSIDNTKRKAAALLESGEISVEEFDAINQSIAVMESGVSSSDVIQPGRTLDEAEQELIDGYVSEIENLKSAIDPESIKDESISPVVESILNSSENDITGMPFDMLDRTINALENLSNGELTADIFAVDNYLKSQDIKKGISKVSKKVFEKISKSKKFKKLTDDVQKLRDKLNLKNVYLLDYFFDTQEDLPVYAAIFRPVEKAFVAIQNKTATATERFTQAVRSNNSIFKLSTQKTKDKIGILLHEARYRANKILIDEKDAAGKKTSKTYTWEDIPAERKNMFGWLLGDNASIVELGGLESDRYQRIRKAYKELSFDENGVLDIEASIKNLSKTEMEMMEAAKQTFRELESLNKANAIRRGEKWSKTKEYVPQYVTQKVGTVSPASEIEAMNKDVEAIFQSQPLTTTTISGAIYEKTNRVFFVETDIERIVARHARETTRDYYMTPAYQQLNYAMKNAVRENADSPNVSNAINALNQSFRDRIVHTMTNSIVEEVELKKLSEKLINHVRTMMLSLPERVPAELVSNVVGSMISNSISPFSILDAKLNKKYEVLIENIGAPSLTRLSRYSELTETGQKKVGQRIADKFISVSDKVVGAPLFIKNFNSRFKEISGKEFNIDEYLKDPVYAEKFSQEIESAAAYGDARVQEEFNAITGIAKAPETKLTPWGRNISTKSKIAKIFGFMQSFNTEEANLFRIGLKEIASGNVRRGGSIISARIARNFIYTTMRGLLAAGIYGLASDDDEVIDKQLEKIDYGKNLLTGFSSLLIGRYGNLFKVAGGVAMSAIKKAKKDFAKDDEELMEAYELLEQIINHVGYARPIPSYGNTARTLSYIIPAYGAVVESSFSLGEKSFDAAAKLYEGEPLDEDEAQFYSTMAAVSEMINLVYPNPVSPTATKYLNRHSFETAKKGAGVERTSGGG